MLAKGEPAADGDQVDFGFFLEQGDDAVGDFTLLGAGATPTAAVVGATIEELSKLARFFFLVMVTVVAAAGFSSSSDDEDMRSMTSGSSRSAGACCFLWPAAAPAGDEIP